MGSEIDLSRVLPREERGKQVKRVLVLWELSWSTWVCLGVGCPGKATLCP